MRLAWNAFRGCERHGYLRRAQSSSGLQAVGLFFPKLGCFKMFVSDASVGQPVNFLMRPLNFDCCDLCVEKDGTEQESCTQNAAAHSREPRGI